MIKFQTNGTVTVNNIKERNMTMTQVKVRRMPRKLATKKADWARLKAARLQQRIERGRRIESWAGNSW